MTGSTTGVRLCRLGPVDQTPSAKARCFIVDDQQVTVFRLRNSGLRAVAAICPTRGGLLADGFIDSQQVICPLHNHAFRLINGQCTTGAPSVRAYPMHAEDGELTLRIDTPQ
jgi:nitrite reductase/ring-hydroxylating ferredoxin subunit